MSEKSALRRQRAERRGEVQEGQSRMRLGSQPGRWAKQGLSARGREVEKTDGGRDAQLQETGDVCGENMPTQLLRKQGRSPAFGNPRIITGDLASRSS